MKRLDKILITGTLSSGKTTIVESFSTNNSVYIVSETARQLIHDPLSLGDTATLQKKLFEEQLRREENAAVIARENGQGIILYDRGLVDVIAYSNILGHQIPNEWMDIARERYDLALILNKDDIFYHPPNTRDKALPVKFRDNIDAEIKSVIQSLQIPFLEISGGLEARIKLIEGIISYRRSQLEGRLGRRPELE